MKQISTSNLLVSQAYDELAAPEAAQLRAEIANDETLSQEWHTIRQMKAELNSLTRSPSPTSLRIIFDHSLHSEQLQEI